jgi:hypothetical protein
LKLFTFMRTRITILTLLLALTVTIGCRAARQSRFSNLHGEGILPVSVDNPYVGTNLLLASEAQQSRYLYNFLKKRGVPNGLEVSDKGFRIKLYYPKHKEVYYAHFKEEEWVVRGPYGIPRHSYHLARSLYLHDPGEPLLEIWGKTVRLKQAPAIRTKVPDKYKSFIFPTRIPQKRVKAKSKIILPIPTPTVALPKNFDQQALDLDKNKIKKSDLLHTVTTTNETLITISQWYTGDATNIIEVRKANNINPNDKLTIGQKILIPASLIKKTTPYLP